MAFYHVDPPDMLVRTVRETGAEVADLDPDIALWPMTVLSRWPFAGAPAEGIWPLGWMGVDNTGTIWVCTQGGEPGTWEESGGIGNFTSPLLENFVRNQSDQMQPPTTSKDMNGNLLINLGNGRGSSQDALNVGQIQGIGTGVLTDITLLDAADHTKGKIIIRIDTTDQSAYFGLYNDSNDVDAAFLFSVPTSGGFAPNGISAGPGGVTTQDTFFVRTGSGKWTTEGGVIATGINTSVVAVPTTPTLSGTAQQLSTTEDVMVYCQVLTSGSFQINIGPTSTPAYEPVVTLAATSADMYTVRLPAGWWITKTGSATFSTLAVPC
jgi:hypothetical protein